MQKKIIVGVSGASGVILAQKAIRALIEKEYIVELVLTKHALYTATVELGKEFSTPEKFMSFLSKEQKQCTHIYSPGDVGAPICSGSYKTHGMIVVPCSMASIAAISLGLADNCLRRAADVTIKERRPLVIVFREAPLSSIHLEHMLKLSQLGVTILPPLPAWYSKPQTLGEVEDFIVGKILDAFHIEHTLYTPYSGEIM
jgi:4-hydroxy-3-polyprenylbenzoate decarboxylase